MIKRDKGLIQLNYDFSISEKLRNKVNEKVNITIKTEDSMKKNKVLMNYDAWNRICACMDRISDTLDYMNGMTLGKCRSQRAAFDFYEYINCCYVVIECVEALCDIFKVNKDFKKEKNIFESLGSDEEYFKYVRSLAVVHPVETNGRHPFIPQSTVVQCSPFVIWKSPIVAPFKPTDYDLEMVVYSSKLGDKSQWLHISIDKIDAYLTRWLDKINDVIIAIDSYNDEYLNKYRKIPIKNKNDFENMVDYITYLKEENNVRNGNDNDYIFDKYINVFNIKLSSVKNQQKLEKYKKAIEYSLVFFSNSLQNMSNDGFENTGIKYTSPNIETSLFHELDYCYNYDGIFKSYSYEISKSYYLDPNSPYGYGDKVFARNLIYGMKDVLSKYVDITGNEGNVELMILIDLAMYLDCLHSKTIINRNIPNDLMYREEYVPSKDLDDLYSEIKYHYEPVTIVDMDGNEFDLSKIMPDE